MISLTPASLEPKDILERSLNIKTLPEIFHAGEKFCHNKILSNNKLILDFARLYDLYLDNLVNVFDDKNAILIDVKYNSLNTIQKGWCPLDHIHVPYLIRKIRQEKLPVLHLTRFNYLSQYVSEKIASKNQLYATEEEVKLKQTSVYLDISDMLKTFEMYYREDNLIKRFFLNYTNYLTFDYDEFFFGTDEIRNDIFGRLQQLFELSEGFISESKFKKLNTKTFSETIENYQEVIEALNNTQFEYCLNDVLSSSDIQEIILHELQ